MAWIAYRIFGFMWGSFFWTFAPIPSSTYPFSLIQWPIRLMTDCMWITRQIQVSLHIVLISFGFMAVILAIGTLLSGITGIPFSASGLVAGASITPPYVIPIFLGSAISRFLVPRTVGKKWWDEHRGLVVGGFAVGEGVVIGIGIVCSLLVKTIWTWPY
ncbi:MAG: hypothetical protein FGF48_10665 [Candidatus Brockarchaeota archaeon]|nr:hypothetical protein [Candidatus Brockarchaeota archaeon]